MKWKVCLNILAVAFIVGVWYYFSTNEEKKISNLHNASFDSVICNYEKGTCYVGYRFYKTPAVKTLKQRMILVWNLFFVVLKLGVWHFCQALFFYKNLIYNINCYNQTA